MPYLAFDLDAMDKAPHVGRATGIPEDAVLGGLMRMWRYCWAEKTDHVDGVAIRGFFGQDTAAALVSFRFLEPDTDGFRVRGAKRYLRISEARSRGGKAASKHLIPGAIHKRLEPKESLGCSSAQAQAQPKTLLGSPSALTPNTEHRAPSILTTAAAPPVSASPPLPKPNTPTPTDFEPDADGEFKPTAWGFWGWHNAERQRRSLYDESTPPHGFLEWHDAAVAKVGMDGLARAYLHFLQTDDFRHRKWPINVFRSPNVWETRASPEPAKVVRL